VIVNNLAFRGANKNTNPVTANPYLYTQSPYLRGSNAAKKGEASKLGGEYETEEIKAL